MSLVVAGVPFFFAAFIAAALAVLVFYHGPDRAVNRALATLALATAAATFGNGMGAISSADSGSYLSSGWANAGDSVSFLAIVATLPLALAWPAPRPWAPRFATRLWPFATVGLLVGYGLVGVGLGRSEGPQDIASWAGAAFFAAHGLGLLSMVASLLLATEARGARDPGLRDAHVLMALGVGLGFVNVAVRDLMFLPEIIARVAVRGDWMWIQVVATPLAALLAAALTWAIWRLPPSRTTRVGRGLLAAAAASGALDSLNFFARVRWHLPVPGGYEASLFLYAFWTLAPIALLAYVVLRGQIPGLDVKVRWGVSKSTVAAVFVAVFFVASEMAQQFFGETIGSQYLGIAAAGALVFAIAPLQRAAERLAERAVPVAAPPAAAAATGAGEEDTYRRAVRWATRDGALTREEERDLVVIAARLGIPPERAFDIRAEVEREPRLAHHQEAR